MMPRAQRAKRHSCGACQRDKCLQATLGQFQITCRGQHAQVRGQRHDPRQRIRRSGSVFRLQPGPRQQTTGALAGLEYVAAGKQHAYRRRLNGGGGHGVEVRRTVRDRRHARLRLIDPALPQKDPRQHGVRPGLATGRQLAREENRAANRFRIGQSAGVGSRRGLPDARLAHDRFVVRRLARFAPLRRTPSPPVRRARVRGASGPASSGLRPPAPVPAAVPGCPPRREAAARPRRAGPIAGSRAAWDARSTSRTTSGGSAATLGRGIAGMAPYAARASRTTDGAPPLAAHRNVRSTCGRGEHDAAWTSAPRAAASPRAKLPINRSVRSSRSTARVSLHRRYKGTSSGTNPRRRASAAARADIAAACAAFPASGTIHRGSPSRASFRISMSDAGTPPLARYASPR